MEEISSIEEFEAAYKADELINKKINIPIKLPYSSEALHDAGFRNLSIEFDNCEFNREIKINSILKGTSGNRVWSSPFTFVNCKFRKEINANDSILDAKIRFRNCHFYELVKVNNTTFKELADFWRCTFYKKTIFYKTDFLNTVVFSAVTFKENVLFTYTLIDKLIILRGTNPKKGFDLSLAIISGDLGVFDFKLKEFEAIDLRKNVLAHLKEHPSESFAKVYETKYENAVSSDGDIPINNKRETYRIIKASLESQKNVAESVPYKLLEKETFRQELKSKKKKIGNEDSLKSRWKKNKYNISIYLDRLNLWLNQISNNHGSSYGRAFLFVVGTGWLFFYLSLIATDSFELSSQINDWEFNKGLRYFMQYLLPTHKFDYMGESVKLTPSFYVFDFIGRTIVGYGIYQFIQAFRKYR